MSESEEIKIQPTPTANVKIGKNNQVYTLERLEKLKAAREKAREKRLRDEQALKKLSEPPVVQESVEPEVSSGDETIYEPEPAPKPKKIIKPRPKVEDLDIRDFYKEKYKRKYQSKYEALRPRDLVTEARQKVQYGIRDYVDNEALQLAMNSIFTG